MDKLAVEELNKTIRVLSFLQIREKALREDLLFSLNNYSSAPEDDVSWLGPVKRLEHEILFLCVDVYSLHKGISKKSSLFSKIIKNKGKEFLKVDNSKTWGSESINIRVIGSGSTREGTPEEIADHLEALNKIAFEDRKALKEEVGLTSHQHSDMDDWMDTLFDKNLIEKLSGYRKEGAHRFNTLDNLERELQIIQPEGLEARLDVVAEVLERYQSCLQKILIYTTSVAHEGISQCDLRYDSLLRIKQWKELQVMFDNYWQNWS